MASSCGRLFRITRGIGTLSGIEALVTRLFNSCSLKKNRWIAVTVILLYVVFSYNYFLNAQYTFPSPNIPYATHVSRPEGFEVRQWTIKRPEETEENDSVWEVFLEMCSSSIEIDMPVCRIQGRSGACAQQRQRMSASLCLPTGLHEKLNVVWNINSMFRQMYLQA